MTLTLPTIVPTKYAATALDFNLVKEDRSGAVRSNIFTVSIPATTVITTIVGLVPFHKGAHLSIAGSSIGIADLDTSTNVTFDLGYTYYDSTLGTSSGAALASASTAAQAGSSAITLITTEAMKNYVTTASGWFTLTLSGGSTTTTGNVYGDLLISYDVGG